MELNLKEEIKKLLNEKENKTNGVHVSDITNFIVNAHNDLFSSIELKDRDKLQAKINGILFSDVKKKYGSEFSKVRNTKTGKDKKGYYKLRQIKGDRQIPPPTPPGNPIPAKPKPEPLEPDQNTSFIGKAGECAVMSELLFRGYNANLMMVDDGVDIVASRKNLYYFIQVKSTTIKDNGKVYSNIKTDRFEAFINAQIRYIIVVRCKMFGIDTNLYFVFNNQNIDQFIYKKVVHMNENTISIKIRIDQNDGNKPFLYHEGKEEDISFFMNNFHLQ